jgi:hypothetical protein
MVNSFDPGILKKLRPVSQIALDETWSALRGRPHEKVKRSA